MKTKTNPSGKSFEDYYPRELGHGGMNVFSGSSMQRGHGIGNVMARFLRTSTPVVMQAGKRAVKTIKPIAMRMGKRVLKAGIKAAKPVLKRALSRGVGAVTNRLFPEKTKPRRPRRTKGRKLTTTNRGRKNDIFS